MNSGKYIWDARKQEELTREEGVRNYNERNEFTQELLRDMENEKLLSSIINKGLDR